MNYKKIISLSILLISTFVIAQEPLKYKLYGFVRSDLYYNSRQNIEGLDGLFNMFPKPKDIDTQGRDKNDQPNSEMLSISSRLGLDFTSTQILGAKTSAKIECDFAGVSQYYYLIRLRQAYLKLNWDKTELLVGQTWHPMFANLQPTTPALGVATPFQPFNRSPQIRLKQTLNTNLSAMVSASYQMQYLSQGPDKSQSSVGASASYAKTSTLPSLYIGLDYKSKYIIAGIGVDGKTLNINYEQLNSGAATAYFQYAKNKFQIKAKTVYGQNLSEHLMIGGYGVTSRNPITNDAQYTNFTTSTSWLSIAYGTKVQVAIYGGLSHNFGSNKDLLLESGNYTAYGYGFYQSSQALLDDLVRIAPNITYNLSNFRLGFEYELTKAQYGKLQSTGKVINPYTVDNHRALATISYIF